MRRGALPTGSHYQTYFPCLSIIPNSTSLFLRTHNRLSVVMIMEMAVVFVTIIYRHATNAADFTLVIGWLSYKQNGDINIPFSERQIMPTLCDRRDVGGSQPTQQQQAPGQL